MAKKILKKIKDLPLGVKASVAYFLANMISKGIAYITTPLYTRLLSSEQYGQVSVFLTWLEIFGIVAMFCLSYGVFNNGMVDYPTKRDDYSFSMLMLSNIITIVFSGVVIATYPWLRNYVRIDFKFLVLMCFIFFFHPAYNFWYTRQRYEMKYKKTCLWSVISAIASPTVAIICIILFGEENRLDSRIFGGEIPLLLIYLGFYVYIGKKNGFKINTKYWKDAFLFNLPLIPHYLSTYLLNSSDKLMISYLIGDSATAYYSVAYSVAAVVFIIWNAINGSLVPYTYEKCKIKDYKSISKVTLPLLLFFACASIGLVMMAPEIVRIMATKSYHEAIYVIPPIVGGVFFKVKYIIYANIIYFYKKPIYVMIGSVTATIVNIVLNYIFISKYGYFAAGYTTIFCYALQALIDYIGMRKTVKTEVYNMRFIILLSLGVAIVSCVSPLLYDCVLLRYLILGALLVLGFIYRKKIIEMITSIRKK